MADREHMKLPPVPRGTKFARHPRAAAGDYPVAAVPVVDKGDRYEIVKRKRDADAHIVYFADGSVAGVIDYQNYTQVVRDDGKLSMWMTPHSSFDDALLHLGSWEARRREVVRRNPSAAKFSHLLNPWGTTK